jgi:2-methylisocitrate lyase-like PEP mutase family enzyme
MSKTSTAQERAEYPALHQQGCFVLPNPWDVGSARMFQKLGFVAAATTSTGFAWTTGRADYAVTREEVMEHLTSMCAAVDIPINADFESGFASEPEGVARNVGLALKTGIAGISIEDRRVDGVAGLYDSKLAAERVQAARASIEASGEDDVILVARTERLLSSPDAITQAIDSLVLFAEAGADCLYAPGVQKKEDIAAMVRAVAPQPVNVLVMNPAMTVAELAGLGVRRVSVGGSLALVAWGATLAAAERMKAGSFEGLAAAMPGARLNDTFRGFN